MASKFREDHFLGPGFPRLRTKRCTRRAASCYEAGIWHEFLFDHHTFQTPEPLELVTQSETPCSVLQPSSSKVQLKQGNDCLTWRLTTQHLNRMKLSSVLLVRFSETSCWLSATFLSVAASRCVWSYTRRAGTTSTNLLLPWLNKSS